MCADLIIQLFRLVWLEIGEKKKSCIFFFYDEKFLDLTGKIYPFFYKKATLFILPMHKKTNTNFLSYLFYQKESAEIVATTSIMKEDETLV